MELVDVLLPPTFTPSGETLSVTEALDRTCWLGTFNLWVVQIRPFERANIIYQQRAADAGWEPNKLDVAAGGHYRAGESLWDGLREAREELGRNFDPGVVRLVGRRLNSSVDSRGRLRNTVVDIAIVFDDQTLDAYNPDPKELQGIFACDVGELVRIHTSRRASFTAHGVRADGSSADLTVSVDSFPANWDNYHRRMTSRIADYLRNFEPITY